MFRILCLSVMLVFTFINPWSLHAAVDEDSPLSLFVDKEKDKADDLSRHSRSEIKGRARQLDAFIGDNLKVHGVKAHAPVSDAVFLRRVYLDIAGRIPSVDEAQSFLKSTDSEKRYELIDSLLNSPAYAMHNFNYWADVLRIKSRLNGGVPGRPYIDYVKQAMKDNKKYDDFVRDLLSSSGSAWAEGNGATGYYIRDAGMPEDNMANTVQIFLGTRVACAQCHDHPFDKWTRKDFLEMSAFTRGVNARAGGLKQTREVRKILGKDLKTDQELRNAVRKLSNGIAVGVQDRGRGTTNVPKDYQYNDLKPGEKVKAHTIFGEQITLGKGDNPRQRYAEWLTDPKNPRFTLVIANRMWKKVMGMGLIEPIDDLKDDTKPSNELLMGFLIQSMQHVDYDLKQFQRMIYYSKAYQREAYPGDWNPEQTYHFPGPIMSRMSSEQIWDSLLTVIIPDIDQRPGPDAGQNYYKIFETLKNMSGKELANVAKVTAQAETKRKEIFNTRIKPLRAQVNNLRKSGKDKKLLQTKQKELSLAYKEHNLYKDGFKFALGLEVDDGGMDMMSMMDGAKYKKKKKQKQDSRWRGFDKRMVRSSELPMPMYPGHFLRQFGQSDREQIENANDDASITQILTMLNGFTHQHVLNARSQLMKKITAAKDNKQRVDTIFLSILGRYPSPDEWAMCERGVKQYQSKFYSDLVWALVNTHEFIFVQ